MLSEIRSFVFTVVVVALGFAFLSALFTGGAGSVEQLLGTITDWFLQLCRTVLDTVNGWVPETSR